MIIEIKTPNNTAREELDILQQILNIDGERFPFKIADIKEARFYFHRDEGYRKIEG